MREAKFVGLGMFIRKITVLAVFAIAGMNGGAGAQMINAPRIALPYSPIPGRVIPAGLWDKPNQACMTKCEVFVRKGCFTRLSEKDPAADPGSIQDRCDDKFSVCLYDCMCDTCDENQIIIKQPQ